MSRVNVGLIVATVFLVILNIGQFIFWRNSNMQSAELYTSEIAGLSQTIESYGEAVTVYTVSSAVKPGDEIKADNIDSMKMYSSLLTPQYVTDKNDIIGRYYKIGINPGTAITKDMVMDEELEDSMRDHDIVLDSVPVGLKVGDYIDIRVTMPYGDDYVVITHKRVYGISEGTIKLYLNELEWNIYQGALVDYFLNKEYGCTLYGVKYVEPGLQQEAVNFYAVPTNIAALLQKNPNIIDKEEAASLNEWRQSLEELLVIFRDESDTVDADGSRLNSGRTDISSKIEADRVTQAELEAERAQEEAELREEQEALGDDAWSEEPTDAGGTP